MQRFLRSNKSCAFRSFEKQDVSPSQFSHFDVIADSTNERRMRSKIERCIRRCKNPVSLRDLQDWERIFVLFL